MSQRYIMRVELTRQAKRDLAHVADRQGMTQLSMLSRVVRWLSDQPTSIQAAVLGLYVAEGNEDVGRMVLRQLASARPIPEPTPTPSTPAAHAEPEPAGQQAH